MLVLQPPLSLIAAIYTSRNAVEGIEDIGLKKGHDIQTRQ
jgi:hypothetical protein